MKKGSRRFFNVILAVLAITAVFAASFVMGRSTALKNSRELSSAVDEAERAVAVLPLLRASEAEIPPLTFEDEETEPPIPVSAKTDGETEEVREDPPFPLPLPVDGSVSKAYSLQAVYSETMGDWRAHMGMDIEAPLTTAVKAPAEGKVTAAYSDRLWGNVIEIQHSGGLKTVYKGVSTLEMVKVGETVEEGDVITGVGTSPLEGKTAAHLHFEIWQDDLSVNPESYVVE